MALQSSAFLWRYEPIRRTGKSDDWLTFFASIIRFTVQKFQLFWVIFCIIIFFIELWHILIFWLAKMPNGGMPVFTFIATGWRYRKYCFTKKHCFKVCRQCRLKGVILADFSTIVRPCMYLQQLYLRKWNTIKRFIAKAGRHQSYIAQSTHTTCISKHILLLLLLMIIIVTN